jgi:predicted PurR-regulated permease PerM
LSLASFGGRPVRNIPAWSVTGLFVLACLYTLAVARPFLLPLAVGLIAYFLLRPVVRMLRRARIPEPLGAALVLVALACVLAAGLYALSWPAADWVSRAPQSLRRVEARVRPLTSRLQRLGRTAAEVEKIAEVGSPDTPQVEIREASLGATVFGGMQSFLGNGLIILTLLYFLLASGDTFVHKVVESLPRLEDRRRAKEIARQMEWQISQYLLLTTVINIGFGAVVGGALWLLGMPNPLLWGAVAAVTNFVPYLGALVCLGVLTLAAVATYENLWAAAAVPLVFFALNTIEGYVVTPVLMGRRFTLDPAVLFVGLLFWWYVWGIPGALLAVPMMAAFKIVCEQVEPLQGLAVFLGEDGQAVRETPAGPSSVAHPGPRA